MPFSGSVSAAAFPGCGKPGGFSPAMQARPVPRRFILRHFFLTRKFFFAYFPFL
jgi:hypothetical protein